MYDILQLYQSLSPALPLPQARKEMKSTAYRSDISGFSPLAKRRSIFSMVADRWNTIGGGSLLPITLSIISFIPILIRGKRNWDEFD